MISAVKDRLARLSLVGRFIALALVVAVALACIAPIGAARFGPGAWVAAAAAALTVLAASVVSIALAEVVRLVVDPAIATVAATLLRMGLALLACMAVHFSGGALSAGGYVYYLLAFYLIVLPLETAFEVTRVGSKVSNTKTVSA